MKDLYVAIYVAKYKGFYKVAMTHNPGLDGNEIFSIDPEGVLGFLTPFISLGLAEYLMKKFFAQEEQTDRPITEMVEKSFWPLYRHGVNGFCSYLDKKAQVLRRAAFHNMELNGCFQENWKEDLYPCVVSSASLKGQGEYFEFDENNILNCLSGRMLYFEELQKALKENQLYIATELQDALQVLALRKKIKILPAVTVGTSGVPRCHRCGSQNVTVSNCAVCGLPSIVCEQCSSFGEARSCRALYYCTEEVNMDLGAPTSGQSLLNHDALPCFTTAQEKASELLNRFVASSELKECLLWAVTGAGKTEVVLKAIDSILCVGGKVLYAAPRRDVVAEIAPRLKCYFPQVELLASYGGSPAKYLLSSFVAATTHQVIRYNRQFNLVILDEVDAFPYQGNHVLAAAVQRALKPGGKIIYLTATPSKELIQSAQKGKMDLIMIPARHHGHQIPVPNLMKIDPFLVAERAERARGVVKEELSNMEKPCFVLQPEIKKLLLNWLVDHERQVFIFLPTVAMVEQYFSSIKEALTAQSADLTEIVVEFSHAKDKDRELKRERFKKREFRVFLTTSIMERGITVRNAHVLVLNADFSKVLDGGTLIQMAGRAGRSTEFPTGEVTFVARSISPEMKEARETIVILNELAMAGGYLGGIK